MEERLVRFCAADASPPVFVEGTPALVCKLCGERYYSDATVSALERVKAGSVARKTVVAVDSYVFADAVAKDIAGSR
jgi:hypothetical protein